MKRNEWDLELTSIVSDLNSALFPAHIAIINGGMMYPPDQHPIYTGTILYSDKEFYEYHSSFHIQGPIHEIHSELINHLFSSMPPNLRNKLNDS